jgi:hypothetical protein
MDLVQDDDRRIAEVQYKRCCALQFGGAVEAALPAVQVRATALPRRLHSAQRPAQGDVLRAAC